MVEQVRVGMIGCGNIAPAYVQGCRDFDILELAGCADIDFNRAQQFGAEYNIPAYRVSELLAHPDIDIVINLTIPRVHAEVSLSILEAGKHVYTEKPFALTRADGQKVLSSAKARALCIGCAPDTFLGGGGQTARKLIDDGVIGRPVAASAFMQNHGPESWHPNPAFYYDFGGGPLFDMAPYYITSLVNFLGGVSEIAAIANKSFDERITSDGTVLPVNVNTHYSASLRFASGAVGTLITSFDVWGHTLPRIEIHGTEGSLRVPDPNIFGGAVYLLKAGDGGWTEVELTHSDVVSRGIGVADMAYGLRYNRPHRASGALGFHVLDVMQAIEESSAQGQHVQVSSTVEQPAPLPIGLEAGTLDGA